jgi:hypothetical protein
LNRPSRIFAFGFLLAVAAAIACSSPAVGDQCSGGCPSKMSCEAICECGNASCPAYQCVTISATGGFQLADGKSGPDCSQL